MTLIKDVIALTDPNDSIKIPCELILLCLAIANDNIAKTQFETLKD